MTDRADFSEQFITNEALIAPVGAPAFCTPLFKKGPLGNQHYVQIIDHSGKISEMIEFETEQNDRVVKAQTRTTYLGNAAIYAVRLPSKENDVLFGTRDELSSLEAVRVLTASSPSFARQYFSNIFPGSEDDLNLKRSFYAELNNDYGSQSADFWLASSVLPRLLQGRLAKLDTESIANLRMRFLINNADLLIEFDDSRVNPSLRPKMRECLFSFESEARSVFGFERSRIELDSIGDLSIRYDTETLNFVVKPVNFESAIRSHGSGSPSEAVEYFERSFEKEAADDLTRFEIRMLQIEALRRVGESQGAPSAYERALHLCTEAISLSDSISRRHRLRAELEQARTYAQRAALNRDADDATRAIRTYEAVLSEQNELSRDEVAQVQGWLATTLLTASTTNRDQRINYLLRARGLLYDALSVFSLTGQDFELRQVLQNNALVTLELWRSLHAEPLIEESVRLFREALKLTSWERDGPGWGIVAFNAANAIREYGRVTNRIELVRESRDLQIAALSVRTLDNSPREFAMSQNSLGGTFRLLWDFSKKKKRRHYLAAERAYIQSAQVSHMLSNSAEEGQALTNLASLYMDQNDQSYDPGLAMRALQLARAGTQLQPRLRDHQKWLDAVNQEIRALEMIGNNTGSQSLLQEAQRLKDEIGRS